MSRNILALFPYQRHARTIANRMKDPADGEAILEAAEAVQEHVDSGATIVPVPSSTGMNPANAIFADTVARLVDGRMVKAVERIRPVPSSVLLRRAGLPTPTLEDHIVSMAPAEDLDVSDDAVIVDNVITSGTSIAAVRHHLGFDAPAVVYADARCRPRENPAPSLRVCVAGSREYVHVHRIEAVLRTVPSDSTIVHGGARGADEAADWTARRLGFAVEVVRANRSPVATCGFLYAFWNGVSRGTLDAINYAKSNGIPFEIVTDDE